MFKLTERYLIIVGYVITCDKIRIYHAGDTDFIPEMNKLKDITFALVPLGEGNTAMNPETAARAVNVIQPEFAGPMHYELIFKKRRNIKRV